MTAPRVALAVALVASIAAIASALLFQYVGGLQPCELCLAERWPYYVAIPVTAAALATGARGMPWWLGLVTLIFLASAGLGAYHVGVEQHWIAGPTACTGGGTAGAKSIEDLQKLLLQQQPVRCDEIQWSLFSVSLAGWNLVISLMLLVFTAGQLQQVLSRSVR
jgi:disulfide bond formation protein DsbB